MKSLLIVIKDENFSRGIAIALLDHFQSVHSTKNPYEALKILKKEKINTIITENSFSTIEEEVYLENLIMSVNPKSKIIIIQDAPIQMKEKYLGPNIIIQQKPITIKSIVSTLELHKNKTKNENGEKK